MNVNIEVKNAADAPTFTVGGAAKSSPDRLYIVETTDSPVRGWKVRDILLFTGPWNARASRQRVRSSAASSQFPRLAKGGTGYFLTSDDDLKDTVTYDVTGKDAGHFYMDADKVETPQGLAEGEGKQRYRL